MSKYVTCRFEPIHSWEFLVPQHLLRECHLVEYGSAKIIKTQVTVQTRPIFVLVREEFLASLD